MTQLLTSLLALLAVAGPASARPQNTIPTPNCDESLEYADGVIHEGPFAAAAESAGGMSCLSSSDADGNQGCAHTKSYTHSVGVTHTISGGLSGLVTINKIFMIGGDVGYSKSWSETDLDAVGTSITCPKPEKGKYECGVQVTPKKIKVKGKARVAGRSSLCPTSDPGPWQDYEVQAPHTVDGGANDGQKADALWEACIRSCGGTPGDFDCEGVKSARANGVPLCPDVSATQPDSFAEGWCTGHVVQRQRWQNAIGDRFRFDVRILDANGNEMTKAELAQVDEGGNLSLTSPLPYTFDIKTTGEDNDAVQMCYADQCWSCGDDDSPHGCTLGDGKENGYEDGKRQGDFGFTCNRG